MAKTKNKRNRTYFGIFVFFVVIILFFVLYVKFSVKADTKVVYQGSSEKVITAKGIAVFDEELISSEKSGVPIINYSDGTRVLAKTHVATIYSGDIDESKSNQIKQLNEKINYLETNKKNYYNSGKKNQSISGLISDKMKKISKYSLDGSIESALSETEELGGLVSANDTADLSAQLESLKAQRADIERTITKDKVDYISETAGAIYTIIDGYETTVTKDALKDADVKVFQSLWNSKPVNYEKTADTYVYGKIINNYEIKVMSLVTTKDADGLSEGKTVYIRLSSHRNSKIPAVIEKIVNNGSKTLIILNVTKDTEAFLGERKFEFEFIKETYNGLKVPREAIITSGGKSYVYIVKDGIVRKRELEILSDSGDVIVKENNSSEEGLLLYDLVIVKSKNISEGMVVGY